jgi:hypothetical protein
MDRQDRIVINNRIDVRPLNYMDNLLLVVSASGYSHQFLNGTQNPWG